MLVYGIVLFAAVRSYEDLVVILTHVSVAVADVVQVTGVFLVRQVETGTVRHVHFETSRSKALGLRFLNRTNLLFGMTH